MFTQDICKHCIEKTLDCI